MIWLPDWLIWKHGGPSEWWGDLILHLIMVVVVLPLSIVTIWFFWQVWWVLGVIALGVVGDVALTWVINKL